MATGRAMIKIPIMNVKQAKILPKTETGVISPYPTVVIVTIAHHIDSGIET